MKPESAIWANEVRRLVMRKLRVKDPAGVECPREKSGMTPCVARDGELAVADGLDGDVCVGCEAKVKGLYLELTKGTPT